MVVNIATTKGVRPIRLDEYITPSRQMIWVGAQNDKVYNTIVVETEDTFLCTIAYDRVADAWLLTRGQLRTECRKGLLSDRAKACSMCRGCCVNPRTARPDYSLRLPEGEVLLNGVAIAEQGVLLQEGDTITLSAPAE